MKSHRLLGGAFASALIAAGWAGVTFSPIAAAVPNTIVFSPNPIATPDSLTPGVPVTICVREENAGTVLTGKSITLSLATNDVPPIDATSGSAAGGSASVGGSPLPGTFPANSDCGVETNAVDVTYLPPDDIAGANNGNPYPVWGGRDILTGTDSVDSTVTNTAVYEFSPVSAYTFSDGPTIAPSGSLTSGQQVTFTVQARDSGGGVPDASVLLWLSTAALDGGTVTASGASPALGVTFCTVGDPVTLTSQSPAASPVRCVTNGSGDVSLTYTAGSRGTAVGVDTVTAQNHPSIFFSAATSYAYQVPGAYTALQPYRICDTRSTAVTGYSTECSGDPIGQGSTLDAQITGVTGSAGQSVPSDAQSVVLNLTAIGGSATTYLTVFPAGTAPPNASNVNPTANLNEANLVVVPLGTGGQVGIYNSAGTINVAVDVEGYFAAPSGSAGLFHPIAPLRICDTRSTSVTGYGTECSGDALGQGQWEKVVVSGCPTGDPSCTASVPTSDAASVALNLTAVTGTASTFLSVVPPSASDLCPTGAPGFSNVNLTAGTNLPNRVIVPLGPANDVCVYNSAGTINFILDVNGWFGNGSESTPGALFYAISPTRICDTRSTTVTGYGTECSGKTLGQGATLVVPVAGVDGVPSAGEPVAMIANVTATGGNANTYFTLYPSDVAQPNASDLNVSPGQTVPNLVVVQLATTGSNAGDVNLFNAAGSINAIVDVSGWFQTPPS